MNNINENYFLYPESKGKRGLSNDFMTRRNNITRYTASFANGENLNVLSRNGKINACVCKTEDSSFELQITAGRYYPDLQWGNYFGKKSLSIKEKIIRFSLCVNGEK